MANPHDPVATDIVFGAAARVGDVLDACAEMRTSYDSHEVSVGRDDDVIAAFRGDHRPSECRA